MSSSLFFYFVFRFSPTYNIIYRKKCFLLHCLCKHECNYLHANFSVFRTKQEPTTKQFINIKRLFTLKCAALDHVTQIIHGIGLKKIIYSAGLKDSTGKVGFQRSRNKKIISMINLLFEEQKNAKQSVCGIFVFVWSQHTYLERKKEKIH